MADWVFKFEENSSENQIVQELITLTQIIMKTQFLYIHGLNSDATSRKYLNLKEYFQGKFEFDCLEWKNDDNISELLDKAELKLENEINPILFGDSTGANFAWQLRERRRHKGKDSILILSSPLLDVSKRIAEFEFPGQLKTYLNKIEHPTDAMLIVPTNDELIEHTHLWENELENINLLKVEDTHRLPNFKDYLPEIEQYISIKTNE